MKKKLIPVICLLVIIASCSKKASVPTTEKAIDAAPLYANNCARCHGADGATGRAPNLTKIDLSKGEIADVINNGKGRMPSFTDKLTAKEIAALAMYVEKLKK